jgi:hypothetical protein
MVQLTFESASSKILTDARHATALFTGGCFVGIIISLFTILLIKYV